jgi:hypothetical protein
MCQTAAEALRHGGLDPFNLALRNTGVFIGHAQGSNLAGDFTYGTCIEEAAQFLREVPGFDQLPPADQESIIGDLVETVALGDLSYDLDAYVTRIERTPSTTRRYFEELTP